MQHQFSVTRRAFKEALKDAKLDNLVSAMISLAVQAFASFLVWRLAGDLDVLPRLMAAVVPLLTLPIAFVVRLVMAPAGMAKERLVVSAETIDRLTQELDAARAAGRKPVRDPDAVYQRSRIVGRVIAPKVDLAKSTIIFEMLTDTADLDVNKTIEYREYSLTIFAVRRQVGMKASVGGGSRTLHDVLEGVTCQITGTVPE